MPRDFGDVLRHERAEPQVNFVIRAALRHDAPGVPQVILEAKRARQRKHRLVQLRRDDTPTLNVRTSPCSDDLPITYQLLL